MGPEILQFLKEHDAAALPVTELEIMGRDLFVRPSEYLTRAPAEGRFETHEVYADLQYIVSGAEIMQVVPSDRLTPVTPYDAKTDFRFFTADQDITDLIVRAGEFTVFFPGEAHKPMCQRGEGPEFVKKLVFKIRMK
jgi:biofilm protein TabA